VESDCGQSRQKAGSHAFKRFRARHDTEINKVAVLPPTAFESLNLYLIRAFYFNTLKLIAYTCGFYLLLNFNLVQRKE